MKNKIVFIALMSLTIFSFANTSYADTTIHLDIETLNNTVYNQDITVTPCDSDGDILTPDTITAYCALVQSNIPSDWSGLWINSINGVSNDNELFKYWMWLANLNTDNSSPDSSYNLSAKQYELKENDKILFYFDTNPLNISVNNSSPTVGENVIINITELGLDNSFNPIWQPAIGGKIVIGSDTFDLDGTASYSFLVPDTNPFTIKGQKDSFINTSEVTITPVAAPTPEPEQHNSSGSRPNKEFVLFTNTTVANTTVKPVFDLKKAFDFLISQQKENGSFGESLYTDWATLAISSGNYQEQTIKLIKHLNEIKILDASLTDYERHAMALMSLGLNPYNTNGVNYIEKIVNSFDGKQFGDANEDNDDIFALIVLQNAGYTIEDKMINDDISFILGRQKENGSFDESVDMTGATIEALSIFKDPLPTSPNPGMGESLEKAKEFLKQNQKDTGGWNNVSSTAWALEGITTLGEKIEDWKNGENTPLDYLATVQDTDGGIKNDNIQNKIWETSYIISILSGKTWNQIMQKFEKPITPPVTPQIVKKIQRKATLTASVINATTPPPIQTKEEIPTIPAKNWFVRLLENIFGF